MFKDAFGKRRCLVPANAMPQPIHDRMPVIIEEPDSPVWPGEAEGDHPASLRPAAEGVLRRRPSGTAVNSVRNNGPELLTAIAAAPGTDRDTQAAPPDDRPVLHRSARLLARALGVKRAGAPRMAARP